MTNISKIAMKQYIAVNKEPTSLVGITAFNQDIYDIDAWNLKVHFLSVLQSDEQYDEQYDILMLREMCTTAVTLAAQEHLPYVMNAKIMSYLYNPVVHMVRRELNNLQTLTLKIANIDSVFEEFNTNPDILPMLKAQNEKAQTLRLLKKAKSGEEIVARYQNKFYRRLGA